ncbi:MAG: alpha/beta hydrolase [Saprospiraceae bacterium]|nr:alpha/beta hydrolase [Saprospiraceae bacterium]
MQAFRVLHLTLLIAILSTLSVSAQPELNATKVDRNVVFGMYSGLALLMDVYYPEKQNGYGIIHITGSAWSRRFTLDAKMINHNRHVKFQGEALVKAGYTLFSINHRAAPRFLYPAAVEDAQRAVRYIRYHADKFGIDPHRIGAIGGSSGGHLVCMLGVLDGNEIPVDDTPINRVSSKVQCVIANAPPTSFLESSIGDSFLGFKKRDRPSSIEYKTAREASPIFHVSPDDPPFLLVHGDKDEIVPMTHSKNMHKKLTEMNVVSKLYIVEGGAHGPGLVNTPEWKNEFVNWMDEHLMKK